MDILKKLKTLGDYKSYIVGDAVRDMLMGIESKEKDIVTNIPLEILERVFKTHNIIGNKKMVGIEYEDCIYRVSQLRSNVNIEKHLENMDFTINAMAWDGRKIIDPFR
jgi:poly(A) polymerase